MPPIKNKSVLVIGGTSGIGLGVADTALAEGAKVHVASSNSAKVEQTVAALQKKYPTGKVSGSTCDLLDTKVEKNLEQLLETVKPVDHIVFTAGDALAVVPIGDITLEAIHKAGHVRFAVPLLLGKLASRTGYLTPGYQSSITFTGGVAGEKPFPNWSLIGPYLAGLPGLVRNLALDLKPLRVNLVSPGAVDTPLFGPNGVPDNFKKATTLGKVGTPEEVAEAYIYFMKDTNVTGTCISTNAGSVLV